MKNLLLSFSALFVAVVLVGQGCAQSPAGTNNNANTSPAPVTDTTAANTLDDQAGAAGDETAASTAVVIAPADEADEQAVEEAADEETSAPLAASETQEFTMTARQWEFEPATITVNEGDRVKLTITSEDVDHGFSLPDFGVTAQLEPGETEEVEFVADEAGTYSFFCNNFCGSGHGSMKGTLIVQ
jgi:cytochrome c oxidase subunit 2